MTVKQTVEITNKLGMHARPAMKLFELMQGFDAEVLLRNDEGTEAEATPTIRKARTEIVLNQRHLYILCAFHFQKNLKKTLRGIV